jgi:hypothetical protein
VGVALLYAAVWVYELGNYVTLSAVGAQASFILSGVLPIGVSASVPDDKLLMLAKPAQIALSTLVMVGIFSLVRSKKLEFSSTIAATTISVFLASAYWELLSSLGSISYEAHLLIFAGLAIGAQVLFSERLHLQAFPHQ